MDTPDSDFANRIAEYIRVGGIFPASTLIDLHPLAGVPTGEFKDVISLAVRAARAITEWTRDYPSISESGADNGRAVWSCLCSASTFPDGPLSLVVDYAALILTGFAYDDIMDGDVPNYTYPRLADFTEQCHRAVTGQETREIPGPVTAVEQQVIDAYRDGFRRVRRYPAARWAGERLTRYWAEGFKGMCQEARWRLGVDPAPDLLTYLDNGVASIFVPLFGALKIAMSDLPASDEHDLRAWDQATRLSGLAIRLSNDLRTAERERDERNVNAVSLLIEAGRTQAQAADIVRAAVQAVRADLATAVQVLPERLAGLGRALLRGTRFGCGWYQVPDTASVTGHYPTAVRW